MIKYFCDWCNRLIGEDEYNARPINVRIHQEKICFRCGRAVIKLGRQISRDAKGEESA